jgi:hypothetical protein
MQRGGNWSDHPRRSRGPEVCLFALEDQEEGGSGVRLGDKAEEEEEYLKTKIEIIVSET